MNYDARPSVHPSVHPSICLPVHLSICPFVRLSLRLSVRPSVCPSVHGSLGSAFAPTAKIMVFTQAATQWCIFLGVYGLVSSFRPQYCLKFCSRRISKKSDLTHQPKKVHKNLAYCFLTYLLLFLYSL